MSTAKAFILSLCILSGIILVAYIVEICKHMFTPELICVVVCGVYFLIVSTWFWSSTGDKEDKA